LPITLSSRFQDILDSLIEAKVSRLEDLPARKCQQLPDQCRDAVALQMNLVEIPGEPWINRRGLLFSKFCPA
jgi:hypothetical protein